MKKARYDGKAFGSLRTLAINLNLSERSLRTIANRAEDHYIANKPIVKASGGSRQTYSVGKPLKRVQEQIVREIFHRIAFPEYIQGSVKSRGEARDYITDASIHVGAKVVLKHDIANFFASIQVRHVRRLWQRFFNFPPEVASVLAELTTYQGFVPEGAPTSSYIANLIFWETEPQLEYKLRKEGFKYSRFVDDIAVSNKVAVHKKQQKWVTESIYAMYRSVDVSPNRLKRKVLTNSDAMRIHGLNVNSGTPTVPRETLSIVRAQVKQCELLAETDRSSDQYRSRYNSVRGKVASIARVQPNKARHLESRLNRIRPVAEGE